MLTHVLVTADILGGSFSLVLPRKSYEVNLSGKVAPTAMRMFNPIVDGSNELFEVSAGELLPPIELLDHKAE